MPHFRLRLPSGRPPGTFPSDVPVGSRGKAKGSLQDFDHVTLVFSAPDRPRPAVEHEIGRVEAVAGVTGPGQHAGFVVTVGLRTELEAEFHERVILAHHDRPYAELCERIMSVRDQFS